MPGMGGEGFYRMLQEQDPALLETLIFASGDIVSASIRDFLQRANRPVLAKPYELKELAALLQEVLADTS